MRQRVMSYSGKLLLAPVVYIANCLVCIYKWVGISVFSLHMSALAPKFDVHLRVFLQPTAYIVVSDKSPKL